MASLDPERMLAQARAHPVLVIGGAVGIGVALYVMRGQVGGAPVDPTAVDPNAVDPNAVDPNAAATDPSSYPGLNQYQGSTYNPLGDYGGQQQVPPQMTPDGCALPVPNDPPGYEGLGRWGCDAGTWIFTLNQPDRNPQGCPLPVPKVPPQLVGQGKWHCNPTTHLWEWKWNQPAPPGGHHHPHMTIAAGTYRSWANVNHKTAAGPADFAHTGASVVFVTGPKETGVHVPGASGKAVLVRVSSAPGHTAIVGRWMRPTSDWAAS